MHARMTKFVGLPPKRIDDAVEEFRGRALAELEEHEGFEGVMVLVDRSAGTAAALSFWESDHAMRQSERTAERARESAVALARPERHPIVDHFEVVLQRSRDGAAT